METGAEVIAQELSNATKGPFFRSLVRLLVAFALLVILFQLIEIHDVLEAFNKAEFLYILSALILLPLNLAIQMVKWKYMVGLTGEHFSWRSIATSILFGLTLGSFTPGQIGEYGGRALNMPTSNRGTIVGLTILDKLQMLAVMAIGGMWSLVFLLRPESLLLLFISAVLSAGILFLMFHPQTLRSFLVKIGIERLKHHWMKQILDSLLLLQSRHLFVTTALTVIFYAVIYLQLYILVLAFTVASPADVFLGYAATMFVKALLPIALADLGTREISLVYFLSLNGIPEPVSLNASLLLFVINILSPAVLGTFFIPRSLRTNDSGHGETNG